MPRGIPASGVRAPRRSRVTMPPPAAALEKLLAAPATPPDRPRRRKRTEAPSAIDETRARWVQLDERVKTQALRAKAKRRTPLDLGIDEYEQVVDLAIRFDESIQNVLRTCFRIGLRDRAEWASHAAPGAAFALGDWTPRPPSDIDPRGLRRPGAAPAAFVPAPPINGAPYAQPPRAYTVTDTFDETVYRTPPAVDRRYLPSAPPPGTQLPGADLDDEDPGAGAGVPLDDGPIDVPPGTLERAEVRTGGGARDIAALSALDATPIEELL